MAALPFIMGFHPTESLVLVCLRGNRQEVGPAVRVDLPETIPEALAVAEFMATQAARHASGVALVCLTDAPTTVQRGYPSYPRTVLIRRCLAELDKVGVPVLDAVLVRDRHFWSYLEQPHLGSGYSVPPPDDPTLLPLQSAHVGSGRSVLQSRVALAASVAGPDPEESATANDELVAAASRHASEVADLDHLGAVRTASRRSIRILEEIRADGPSGTPSPSVLADLVTAMADHDVRDSVISWGLRRADDRPVSLFVSLARWTPDEWSAPVCSALAAVAYRSGDGALAQVAVERALQARPDYRLAQMLQQTFGMGLHPTDLDRLALPWEEDPANPTDRPVLLRGLDDTLPGEDDQPG